MELSIITVNLNNREGLKRTIESVIGQTGRKAEFLIVDGGSTDGSRELIAKNSSAISWWVSEPDSGVYAAMNKGVDAACGEYLLFLNSGDWLVDDSVVVDLVGMVATGKDVYYANMVHIEDRSRLGTDFPKELDVNFFVSGSINHQNCLIRRDFFIRCGRYDEKYRIVGDWHFFLKAFKSFTASSELIDRPIAFYEGGGISAQGKHESVRLDEIRMAIREVFGELAPSIQMLYDFKHSVFGNTIELFGYSPALNFLLRAYRFVARKLPSLHSANRQPGNIS